jgi:hypothetical protein
LKLVGWQVIFFRLHEAYLRLARGEFRDWQDRLAGEPAIVAKGLKAANEALAALP